jgi:hypothetical protein
MAAYISYQPKDFFNCKLYTGDNTSPKTITGVGFEPSMTMLSSQNVSMARFIWDAVRGGGADKEIPTNASSAEGGEDADAYGYLSAFASDGYTLTAGSINDNFVNDSSSNYITWNWKAGTTGTDLSAGTITPSSSSIDTTRKFGIYAYTGNGTSGATIAHGLGKTPSAIFVKRLNASQSWQVGHSYSMEGDGNDWDKGWNLNTNAASGDDVNYWNDTDPTSTLITLGSHDGCNGNTNTYIMYVWCDVPGMQKFGMYHGNGNANGSAINLGFQPELLITKRLSTSDWNMFSSPSPGYNLTPNRLFANTTATEGTTSTNSVDFLANGFKLRGSGDETNGNQNNYIYFAWSKFPLVSSNDVPGVAR